MTLSNSIRGIRHHYWHVHKPHIWARYFKMVDLCIKYFFLFLFLLTFFKFLIYHSVKKKISEISLYGVVSYSYRVFVYLLNSIANKNFFFFWCVCMMPNCFWSYAHVIALDNNLPFVLIGPLKEHLSSSSHLDQWTRARQSTFSFTLSLDPRVMKIILSVCVESK